MDTKRKCVGCGKTINKKRLAILPNTATCVRCSTEVKKPADVAVAAEEEFRNANNG